MEHIMQVQGTQWTSKPTLRAASDTLATLPFWTTATWKWLWIWKVIGSERSSDLLIWDGSEIWSKIMTSRRLYPNPQLHPVTWRARIWHGFATMNQAKFFSSGLHGWFEMGMQSHFDVKRWTGLSLFTNHFFNIGHPATDRSFRIEARRPTAAARLWAPGLKYQHLHSIYLAGWHKAATRRACETVCLESCMKSTNEMRRYHKIVSKKRLLSFGLGVSSLYLYLYIILISVSHVGHKPACRSFQHLVGG